MGERNDPKLWWWYENVGTIWKINVSQDAEVVEGGNNQGDTGWRDVENFQLSWTWSL